VKRPPVQGESKPHRWYSEDDGTDNLSPEQVAWVELRGPMDCAVYSQAMWEKLLGRLGPDPLNEDGPERAIEKIRRSRKPIAALLMDQSVAAGIGNIFRAELLYRARVCPFLAGKDVPAKKLREIWKDAGVLMKAGMVDRRIITTLAKDRPTLKGKKGKMAGKVPASESTRDVLKEEAHYVYRRHGKECFVCGTKVMREEMAGRNLYWCPYCQKCE
jgi:endonuclease-8